MNLLIVDDHPVVLNGTKALLQHIHSWNIEIEHEPAAGIIPENPTPTNFLAIGPERKATNAIGPVVAVANAMISTELMINISLVLSVSTPSEVAACSPSSSISNRLAKRIMIGAKIMTVIMSG